MNFCSENFTDTNSNTDVLQCTGRKVLHHCIYILFHSYIPIKTHWKFNCLLFISQGLTNRPCLVKLSLLVIDIQFTIIHSTWNFLNLLPSSIALTYKEIFLVFGWIHFHSKTFFQLKTLTYTLDSDGNNQILRFIRWQGSEYSVI